MGEDEYIELTANDGPLDQQTIEVDSADNNEVEVTRESVVYTGIPEERIENIENRVTASENEIGDIQAEQITQNTNIQKNSEEIEEIKDIIDEKPNLITNYTEIANAQLNNVGWWETATGYSTNRKGIPVEGGKRYCFCVNKFPTAMKYIAFKTADDLPNYIQSTFIKRVSGAVYATAPDNAKYMFFTSNSSDFENVTCYEGFSADNIISNSVWTKDKVLMTLGDSLTVDGIWQAAIAGKLGFSNIKNLAVGGTKVNVFADKVTAENIADVDIITIMGFFNSTSSPAGLVTDEASHEPNASICANYKYIIDKLLTLKPTVKIILMTPHCPRADDVADKANAVKQIANYYHLPCIDLYNKAGFNTYTFDNYLRDAVHSSYGANGGYAQEADVIYSQILAWSGTDVSTIEKIKVDGIALTPNENKEVDIVGKENISNKVTSISDSSTDTQYPSAKCIYESQAEQDINIQTNTENIEELQNKVDMLEGIIDTDTATGEELTLTDSARYYFKEFEVQGNTEQATAILPDEYQQVDYIESSGTQYIDTGFYGTGTMVVDLVSAISKTNDQQGIFGASGSPASSSQERLYTGQNGDVDKVQYNYGSQGGVISWSTPISNLDTTTKTKFTFGNGSVAFNDNVYKTYTTETFTNAQTSLIFAIKNTSGEATYLSSMKLYSLKITDNDELKRDFIPCYRKSDNVVGLYDLVNNVFYINAGTGSFTYGAVVSIPNPDYPQEIYHVSGNVEVKVENKNVNDGSIVRKGYYDTSGKFLSNNTFRANVMKVDPNTRYALSTTYVNGLYNTLVLLDKNQNLISTINYTNKNGAIVERGYDNSYFKYAIFTTPDNCYYISAGLLASSNEEYNNKVMLEIIDENATVPTGYVAHEEQTVTLHLPEGMEMRKIVSYADTFVKQEGKWYKNKKITKSGVSAGWRWEKNQDSPNGNYISFMAYEAPWKIAISNSLCNYFVTGYWNTIVGKNANYCWNNGSVVGGFRIHKNYLDGYDASMTNEQKIALFKTWLRNHLDLEVYYKLSTPVLEEITDPLLISDLDNLLNLYSYKGTTYISSSNDPNPIFNVEYRVDPIIPKERIEALEARVALLE